MYGGVGADLEPDVVLAGSGPGVGWQVTALDLNGDTLGDVVVSRVSDGGPNKVRIYSGGPDFAGVADTVLVGGDGDGFGLFLPRGLR